MENKYFSPAVTKQFNVGTTVYHFIDTQRKESCATRAKHQNRELAIQVWYPTNEIYNKLPNPYISTVTHSHLKELINKKEKYQHRLTRNLHLQAKTTTVKLALKKADLFFNNLLYHLSLSKTSEIGLLSNMP